MNPYTEAVEQTRLFIDSAQATPGRLIRERTEQTQNALIRLRMEKHALDDRIASLEGAVAVLQGEQPARRGIAKWQIFGAVGLGVGGMLATAPWTLLWLAAMYLVAAMCFGAVALPLLITRGKL